MKPVSKENITEILESIAQLLELKGENPFKIRAYTSAARALETFTGDVTKMAREDRLREIPGIGDRIAEKIHELVTTGELKFYTELKASFPASLLELFTISGLGPKKIKAVYDQLGVTSIDELEAACKRGVVAELAGFGEKTAANILRAIQQRRSHSGEFRLGKVAADAETLLEDLRSHPDVSQVAVAGSYRRRKEVVHDLDFVVSTKAPAQVSADFAGHEMVEEVLAQGSTKTTVRLRSGIQADLRVVSDDQFPFALNYFTGSKEHNIEMRSRALSRGWTLNEYRLAPIESGTDAPVPPPIHTEGDLYRALDLDFIEPELRENLGEFQAAESGTLPDLIRLENLRGTFHCHTTASDGRCSLEEMAHAAQELGLEYLGIADHSKSSFQAHGLSAEQLATQREQIDALNQTFDGFRIFAGLECDILKDGSLDFPDEILSKLDFVVASVHAVFNLPEAEMTERIIRAISNPYVTILGHVTGRLLLTRDGYKVDMPAIIEAAAATGTAIELNGNPKRLDMDWRWWPLAKEKGVKCVITPDAHHTSDLQYLWFGTAAARKGWLTRKDVLNTLPLSEVEAILKAKRR